MADDPSPTRSRDAPRRTDHRTMLRLGRPPPRPGTATARRIRIHRRPHTRGQRMTPPDIRAFYTALGIPIPGWANLQATVRCFGNPEAHRRGDRDPSCSVNLQHGAWHCHACGAKGGAFDAATARGYTDRAAIDLMVAHGLTE